MSGHRARVLLPDGRTVIAALRGAAVEEGDRVILRIRGERTGRIARYQVASVIDRRPSARGSDADRVRVSLSLGGATPSTLEVHPADLHTFLRNSRVVEASVPATSPATEKDTGETTGATRASSPPAAPDPALWGPEPSTPTAARALAATEEAAAAQRRRVTDSAYTRRQVADLLRISPQAVSDRRTAGRLVAIKDGREWRFPRWQFDPRAPEGVIPPLADLRRVFGTDVVGLSLWMTRPQPYLDGRTPREALETDNVDLIVASARAASRPW